MIINVTKTFLPPIEEYTQYLDQVWDSRWVTSNGMLATELSHQLKQYLNTKNMALVSNGTRALEIAMKSLNVTGEVITTPFSYVATASSIMWIGCKPVFVDIDKETFTIDPHKIEAAVTPNTTAILATHLYGNPCDVETIETIAKRLKLKVIYDAAHTFGASYKSKAISSYGDVAAISFNATKLFHTIEGGGLVAKNLKIATKINNIANFGLKGLDMGFANIGTNGKLSEFHAAIGLAILPYVKDIIDKRRTISEVYDNILLNNHNISKQTIRPSTEYNYAYYPLLFSSEKIMLKVIAGLREENIFPRRYFYPTLNQLCANEAFDIPVAKDIAKRVLCLPLFYELEEDQAIRIANIVAKNC